MLARYLLARYARGVRRQGARASRRTPLVAIRKHRWPGNIRELENRIKKAVVLCRQGAARARGPRTSPPTTLPPILPLADAKEKFQRDYINEVLALNNGNRTKTARDLGVDPRTIFRHLEKGEGGADEPLGERKS